jgi:hypothetical protein
MPHQLLAPAATATLLFLTTSALAADAPGGTMTAEQGWSSIARCAQEDTERARHTCLDRVLHDAGLLTDEMHARQQRRAFGLDDKAARATTPATVAPSPAAVSSGTAAAATAARASSAPAAASTAPAPAASGAPQEALNRRAAKSAANTAAPPAQADHLEVELAKVEKAVDGNLFVTTSDGAVWLQAESVQMPQPPMAGDHMTIRKGSLGGYRCSIVSTHLTYRCVRSR